jgi:hypothetical protein
MPYAYLSGVTLITKHTSLLFFFSAIAAGFLPGHAAGMDCVASEYQTRTGRSLLICESHPRGSSLSDIAVTSSGFEYNLNEILHDRDPIKSVLVADLDSNGFDEFYIVTVSSGSGSYGNIIAFASNNDKSLSMVHFPEIQEADEPFVGYMGHDIFKIFKNSLIRTFPIYMPLDKNSNPTGGIRRLTYDLFPGEAAWQLKITAVIDST